MNYFFHQRSSLLHKIQYIESKILGNRSNVTKVNLSEFNNYAIHYSTVLLKAFIAFLRGRYSQQNLQQQILGKYLCKYLCKYMCKYLHNTLYKFFILVEFSFRKKLFFHSSYAVLTCTRNGRNSFTSDFNNCQL